MVDKATVLTSNAEFARQHHGSRVAVFVGATAGIGESTFNRMITMLDNSTFYVLGRNARAAAGKLDLLRRTASTRSNKVVFIETQVSLIRDIDTACDQIIAAERQVDFLCMSPGGFPWGGAVYTEEGVETCFAMSYYSRLRMVSKLLPLLRRSPQSRVLSILSGTTEKAIDENNLGLEGLEKGRGMTAVASHATVCTSLAFDFPAKSDDQNKVVFLHATPGFVHTQSTRKTPPSKEFGLIWAAFISTIQVIAGWLIYYFGMSVQESGERRSYLLTSDTYKPGSWQINKYGKPLPPNKALKGYQECGLADKVWDHSLQVWDRALASGHSS